MTSHIYSSNHCQKTVRGFTLIEILITVAIVGILAAIAVPNYSEYMKRGRRVDAMTFLLEVAGEQQRYFSEENRFASDMSDLGYGAAATFNTPEGGHYVVSITVPNPAVKFSLAAAPVGGGLQDGDDCGSFVITSSGGKTADAADCW
ncbi:MAG: type IV pilin protein [Granulosicoccus sp.]